MQWVLSEAHIFVMLFVILTFISKVRGGGGGGGDVLHIQMSVYSEVHSLNLSTVIWEGSDE